MNKYKIIYQHLCVVALAIITGCAQNLTEQKQAIEQSQERIEQARTAHEEAGRRSPPTSIEYPREQAWLYRDIELIDYTMSLRDAVNTLIPGQPVAYRIPPRLNPIVSASPENKTIKAHLDTMAMQANIHWEYAAGTLVFMPTITRQFEIPLYGGGTNTTNVEANNLAASDGGSGVINTLNATMTLANEINGLINATLQINTCQLSGQANQQQQQQGMMQTESARALAGIPIIAEPVQIQECYVVSGAGNLITITARPQTLLRFEKAFNSYLESLHRHVTLKIITVKIDVTDLSQQRLDLDILYESSNIDASASNITADLTSSNTSAAGNVIGTVLDIDFTRAASPWAGSNVILQNLNSISNISVEDSREVLAYSNRLITIQDTERFSYVKEVRRDPETVGQITTIRTSIESDEVYTGQSLNILPSLTTETIGLHIVINESTLTNIKRDGTAEATITLPDTANSDVVFDVSLRNKQTALISSSIRTETTTKEDKSGLLPLPILDRILSNSNEGESRIYQTLYVIEAAFRQ